MSIAWRKLGRLFHAEGQRPWMQTHTAVPTPLVLDDDRLRIYFGTRDARSGRTSAGSMSSRASRRASWRSDAASTDSRPPGHFDDNGVYPGPVVRRDGRLWMYYVGRSNGTPPLYYMAIGLAVSDDGGATFERAREAPLLARSEVDPWMVSTPFVLVEGRWRMWYVSGLGWD